MSEKFAEWFLEVRWPGAGTSCRWPIGKMTDADFLRLTAEEAPAAPLSTLPERPGAEFISHCADHEEAIGALSDALGLTDWDSPSDVITAFRARLSSLERELDGVRNELANTAQCPCTFVGPCHDRCTCVNSASSSGCRRCVRYGSAEQRKAAARRLASIIDAGSEPA